MYDCSPIVHFQLIETVLYIHFSNGRLRCRVFLYIYANISHPNIPGTEAEMCPLVPVI